MRYIKALGLIALFFFSMLFFIQNYTMLGQELTLEIAFFDWHFLSDAVPFYLVVLMAFALGALMILFYFCVDRLRLLAQARQCRKRIEALEREVTALRPALTTDSEESTETV